MTDKTVAEDGYDMADPCADRQARSGWQNRCQHISPSPWGDAQCALALGHEERHAYSPSEATP